VCDLKSFGSNKFNQASNHLEAIYLATTWISSNYILKPVGFMSDYYYTKYFIRQPDFIHDETEKLQKIAVKLIQHQRKIISVSTHNYSVNYSICMLLTDEYILILKFFIRKHNKKSK